MKLRYLLAAVGSLVALNFTSAPASAVPTKPVLFIDEYGDCTFNGISCTPAIDPYGGCVGSGPCSLYTTDPTGKVTANVWIYTLPLLVASTDIKILDPDGTISDQLRTISPNDTAHGLLDNYTPNSNTACIQAQINLGNKLPCANRLIYYSLDDLGGQPFTSTTPAVTTENADGSWTFQGNLVTLTGASDIPVPATLPLFASGLAVLGLLGWRRKRKAQAV